ncbi:hypothetical protein P3T23_007232 [Paraburkholderia sp. GAS448]
MSDHPIHGQRFRQALHTLASCLCAVQLLASQPACAQEGAPQQGHGQSSGGGVSGGVGLPLDLLFGVLRHAHEASSASAVAAPPPNVPTPEAGPGEVKELLLDGPQFPQTRAPDQFEVTALLKGGWPFVVDFMPAPASCTFVVIFIGDQASKAVVIDSDGRQGRHLVRLDFPAGPPESPLPARYRVQSQAPPCPSGNPAAYGSSARPSPLEIYGIGAGPRAVGSVAVTNLHFQPPRPNVRTDRITYAFTTKSLFNRATVSFLRFEPASASSGIRATLIRSIPVQDLDPKVHTGSWDGLDDTRTLSLGIHRLEVRAWDNQEDESSWAGGISDDLVTITRP